MTKLKGNKMHNSTMSYSGVDPSIQRRHIPCKDLNVAGFPIKWGMTKSRFLHDRCMQSGRTMLEMLGVLAIMGVIMYGAIAGIGFGVESYKINATYNMIEDLSQGVVDLYSWSRSYTGDNCGIVCRVCQNDVVECNADGSVKSQWNTGIAVQPVGDGAYFTITLSGLSTLACSRLRDMTYSQLCVKKDSNDGCPVPQGEGVGNTDCSKDGDSDLILISL